MLGTITVALVSRGLEVSQDGVALTVAKSTSQEVREQIEIPAAEELPDPHILAAAVHNKRVEKYDWALSDQLLSATYAARSLDPAGARRAIKRSLGRIEQAGVGRAADGTEG